MAMQKMVRWMVMATLLAVCLLTTQGEGAPGEHRTEVGTAASTSDTSPEGGAAGTAAATAERARRSTAADDGEDGSDYNNDEPEYEDGDGDGEEEDEPTGPPPRFLSAPLNLSQRPGDNVTLPCRVDRKIRVWMWLNGSRTISVNDRVMGGDRIHILPDTSLFIENVQPEDTGAYTCQIPSNPIANLTHMLKVPVPAKIINHSPKQTIVNGDTLHLMCKAEGIPPPTIKWTLQGKDVPNAKYNEDGSELTIESVNKQHGGDYKCVADNLVGQHAAAVTISVSISTKPQVTVLRDMIKSGEGETVELACNVTGQPKPHLKWLKDREEVEIGTSRFEVSAHDFTYTLRIRNLQKSDFGTYTCSAKNKFGTRQKNITVSGTPSIPRYMGHDIESNNIILRWTVESSAPIQAHELLYKKTGDDEWITLKPEVSDAENNMYKVDVEMPALPSGKYEAYFRSQNQYGWTKSETVNFDGLVDHKPAEESTDEKPAAETSKRGPDNGGTTSVVSSLTTLSTVVVSAFVFTTMANHL